MIFNTVTYLIFLVVVAALYWRLPQRPRMVLLFASSVVFYGFWRWEFVPLMLFSALVDYVAALRMARAPDRRGKRRWLAASLAVNLGLLGYFKYLYFFASNAAQALARFGVSFDPSVFQVVLPLGISFYTFQTISYTVDVYRGNREPHRDFLSYAVYVTFFPQLIAGPILRAQEVLPQLERRAPFSLDDLLWGAKRIAAGLFLKTALADNIAPLVDSGFSIDPHLLGALDVWTLAFLFGFQIYFDFSAYSHIAIGSARILGIAFPENFHFPYAATSPKEFWKRWHISLSSWIRDYLYLPLLGVPVQHRSQGGIEVADRGPARSRTFALFATWAIMGLWHGAGWTFVVWGLWHACAVFGHRLWRARMGNVWTPPAVVGWAVTLPVMMLGWVPFRAATVSDAAAMWAAVIDPRAYGALAMRENTYLIAALLLVLVVAAHWWRTWVCPRLRPAVLHWLETPALAVMVLLVFVFLRPINQFIYFQF